MGLFMIERLFAEPIVKVVTPSRPKRSAAKEVGTNPDYDNVTEDYDAYYEDDSDQNSSYDTTGAEAHKGTGFSGAGQEDVRV